MASITDELSEREKEIVKQCLRAAVEGPFFPEWEFHTLFGLRTDEARRALEAWPNGKVTKDVRRAVVGAMNHLTGYPHGEEERWKSYIAAEPEEVRSILDRLMAIGF